MVRGKRVDSAKVEHILRGDPVIVAHNARFDRPFFEKLFPDDGHKWACSMEYCDWQGRGFSGRGLGYLYRRIKVRDHSSGKPGIGHPIRTRLVLQRKVH